MVSPLLGHARLLLIFALPLMVGTGAVAGEPSHSERPNIVLINLDDADVALLSDPMLEQYFPNLHRIAREGTRFTNCHAAAPLCGPSRAALLSGRLPLRSRVRVNSDDQVRSNGFRSGYDSYRELGYLQNDLPIQMKRAGYRTAHVGKYLHPNFDQFDTPNWDHFLLAAGARYHGTVFMRSVDGSPIVRGAVSPETYRTKREATEVVRALRDNFEATQPEPIFMYWAPIAPHTGASWPEEGIDPLGDMIDKRYLSAFPKVTPPWDASVNEADMRDKHPVLERVDTLSNELLADYYRPRLLAVRTFDDQLGRVIRELKSLGEFENTYIFVTSDNGFQIGEHRLLGKPSPFKEASHVPLFVRGPGIPAGVVTHHLLSQIDLFPTLIELAGGEAPVFTDGKSFLPLLFQAEAIPERSWQDAILIQNYEPLVDTRRDVEFPFVYSQLRMFDSTYTEYADGYREFYDLRLDPFELVNLYDSLPDRRKRFLERRLGFISGPAPVEATLSSPPSTHIVGKQNFRIVGYAVSSRPIRSVRLVAKIPELDLYWTGEGWSSDRSGVAARQLDDATILARWEDRISTKDLPSGLFTLSVRSRAYDSRHQPPFIVNERRYVLDTEKPRARMEFPAAGQVEQGPLDIRGTVSDNVKVRAVYVRIMHIPTGRFWNGSEFQDQSVRLQAKLNRNTGEWSYAFSQSRGRYRVHLEAVDMAWNWHLSLFSRKITLRE